MGELKRVFLVFMSLLRGAEVAVATRRNGNTCFKELRVCLNKVL